jgi:hypothetical protein
VKPAKLVQAAGCQNSNKCDMTAKEQTVASIVQKPPININSYTHLFALILRMVLIVEHYQERGGRETF